MNIYPEEIEEFFMCHSSVKEVRVLGEYHELLGEIPIAKIVLYEDMYTDENELYNYCYNGLASYKVPKRIE